MLPANDRWASQILSRYAADASRADVTALGTALDKTTNPAATIRAALLTRPAVEFNLERKYDELIGRASCRERV